MKVFLDTLPRWSGGYLAHLKGILSKGNVPEDFQLVVLGTSRLFNSIGEVDSRVTTVIDDNLPTNPIRLKIWRITKLNKIIKAHSPDVHFQTAGYLESNSARGLIQVTMSRNLQPYLESELKRIPFYKYERLRLQGLRATFNSSFKRADSVIFLTDYARDVVLSKGMKLKRSIVIPHGLSDQFRKLPEKRSLPEKPVILYVSEFFVYKFQWEVARAVAILRKKTGLDIQLHLVGRMTPIGQELFNTALEDLKHPNWIQVTEHVPYSEIQNVYHNADLFVFASSVETIGNIMIEAMASGLPIAYSDRRPMNDMLGSDGVVFEPEDPDSIASAILKYIEDDDFRFQCAMKAYNRALEYSWERTAKRTFEFIRETALKQ